MTATFIHLRNHTEFSLRDGLLRVNSMVDAAVEDGMPAIAVTDQSNLFALVKFYRAAISAGIKPILGADLWLENPLNEAQPAVFTLLAQNRAGYANLTKLISRAHLEGQRQGLALIKFEWLREASEGLIALSGARQGDIGHALLSNNPQVAEQLVKQWIQYFPERFYIELQRTGREGEQSYLEQAIRLAETYDLPVVATNDTRFLHAEDFEAHEARVCIHDGRTLDDPRRARLYSEHQYLKSSAQMGELFQDIPEAIENTLEIAKRCSLEIELGENYLPNYPVPAGMTMDDYFRKLSFDGLAKRLNKLLDNSAPDYQEQRQVYVDRLNFELDIITQMGFPGYFLIVMDFIKWAKQNQVPVGPGRGSGAGSLVAYSLDITDLDPLEYDLLFERFLNPERVSMPDFDVDFCMDGRDRVIEYVAETYGRDAVSQIITFGTMAAKAVVRDVARVQGKPYGLADKLSKMIPFEVGMTLSKAMEQEKPLREFVEQNEEVAEIMEMAFKLEGITRNVGKHAGGVVIAPTRLTDFSPLYCDETGSNLVTQFDKDDVERVGLVKFDFLGLRTLTIIDWAVANVNRLREKAGEQRLDISNIDLEDAKVYKLLQAANTTAVFQLESRGMKDLLRRLEPNTFEDIIALVALFRPGPLQSGMVDDFIARKKGKAELAYPHPQYQHECLKPVLEPSYGIILYQEQVMQIAQTMGGYTLGGADLLRRAMGKKKAEEMAKQRQIFMEGAGKQGFGEELARNIFDLMEKFAGYGFNKSHSAAYALLSYQTAWLKTYYPAPFMAAVLSADMQNTDKVVILLEDCRQMELPLVLPNVNVGEYRFTVDEKNQLVYGLGAIKGLGEGPIESIVQARNEGGPFTDLFDFCARVDLRKVNRRALEALIRSGAMDDIGLHRAALMACLEEAIKTAEQHSQNKQSGMTDLFGGLPGVNTAQSHEEIYADYQHIRCWTEKARLLAEKETLGLYLRGHPIDEYEKELRYIAKEPLVALQAKKTDQIIAGLVIEIRTMKSKRGDTIAFVTLDDRSSRVEVSVFAETYERHRELLMKDNLLVVEGEVGNDDYSGAIKVRAKTIYDVVEARQRFAKRILLSPSQTQINAQLPEKLAELLKPYLGGGCPVTLLYQNQRAQGMLNFGETWRVLPTDELLLSLKEGFGEDRATLCY
ncbi:MAG: DNA polymerase III subunit alpha [Pseudomonadales bacterium]|nr:DNA polymerase III subunit alpha [Pseudomonadales bacterium]